MYIWWYICQEIIRQYDIWLCLNMLDLPIYPLTYCRVNREVDGTWSKFRVLAPSCQRVKIRCSRPIDTLTPSQEFALQMVRIRFKKPGFSWSGHLFCDMLHHFFTIRIHPGNKHGKWKSLKCRWIARWNLHLVRGFSNEGRSWSRSIDFPRKGVPPAWHCRVQGHKVGKWPWLKMGYRIGSPLQN